MTGTMRTAEMLADRRHIDERREGGGIHLLGGGREDQIDARLRRPARIGFEPSRIMLEVFPPVELDGVDEDADDYQLGVLAGPPDQPHMPRVESAHGGH